MLAFIISGCLDFIHNRLFGHKKEEKLAIDYRYFPNQSKIIINEYAM